MSASSGWIRARGQLAFLLGLVIASVIILRIERAQYVPIADVVPPPAILRPSNAEAGAEWAYVTRNTNPQTSLVSDSEGTQLTSLAGIGFAIKAVLAAHRLNFVNGQELHQRVTALITAGSGLELADAGKRISTLTGTPTTDIAPVDIAPYTSALELVSWSYPSLRGLAVRELARWSVVSTASAPTTTAGPVVPTVTPLRRASQMLQRAATIPGEDTR